MPIQDRLGQVLSFINDRTYAVTVALATFDSGEDVPVYRSLNISDELADDFRGIAVDGIARISRLRSDGDLLLREYAAGYKPDSHEIEFVSVSAESLEKILGAVPSPSQIALLGDLDNFVDRIRYYILILSGGNRRVVLYRRYNRNKELLRSKNLVMRLMGERYERLAEPTFQFDHHFDAIQFRDDLFILNKSNFQHIFRYFELLRSIAAESLDAIKDVIPIANFEEFRKSCLSHLQKVEKLRNISQKPYLAKVTMADIKKTISDFGLSVQVAEVNGQEQLMFEASDRWTILNLLDDAYLGSQMTGIKYEANSKRQV